MAAGSALAVVAVAGAAYGVVRELAGGTGAEPVTHTAPVGPVVHPDDAVPVVQGKDVTIFASYVNVNVDSGNTANSSTTPVRTTQTKDPARSTGPLNGSGSANLANFAPATFRTADDPASVRDGSADASLWLTYLSGNHTGEDVPLFAYGPRSGALADTVENTDLFDVVAGALRVDRS